MQRERRGARRERRRRSRIGSPAVRALRGYRSSTSRPTIRLTIVVGRRLRRSTPPPALRPSRKHDEAIGDRLHFFDEVRDVDDRDAPAPSAGAISSNSARTSACAEAARRLVEHEHAAADRERARDLDELLRRRRQIADERVGRDVGVAELRERRRPPSARIARADRSAPQPRRLDARARCSPSR